MAVAAPPRPEGWPERHPPDFRPLPGRALPLGRARPASVVSSDAPSPVDLVFEPDTPTPRREGIWREDAERCRQADQTQRDLLHTLRSAAREARSIVEQHSLLQAKERSSAEAEKRCAAQVARENQALDGRREAVAELKLQIEGLRARREGLMGLQHFLEDDLSSRYRAVLQMEQQAVLRVPLRVRGAAVVAGLGGAEAAELVLRPLRMAAAQFLGIESAQGSACITGDDTVDLYFHLKASVRAFEERVGQIMRLCARQGLLARLTAVLRGLPGEACRRIRIPGGGGAGDVLSNPEFADVERERLLRLQYLQDAATQVLVRCVLPPSLLDGAGLVIPEGVESVGIVPRGVPPHPVIVDQVRAGSFADKAGVVAGDTLLWAQRQSVTEQNAAALDNVLRKSRPLVLYVCRPPFGEACLSYHLVTAHPQLDVLLDKREDAPVVTFLTQFSVVVGDEDGDWLKLTGPDPRYVLRRHAQLGELLRPIPVAVAEDLLSEPPGAASDQDVIALARRFHGRLRRGERAPMRRPDVAALLAAIGQSGREPTFSDFEAYLRGPLSEPEGFNDDEPAEYSERLVIALWQAVADTSAGRLTLATFSELLAKAHGVPELDLLDVIDFGTAASGSPLLYGEDRDRGPEAQRLAAVRIQAFWRGRQMRIRFRRLRKQAGSWIELIAGPNVRDLGMAPTGLPPGPVVLRSVTAGGWSEDVGLRRGDELLVIGDQPVADMLPHAMKSLIRERPVRLVFWRTGHSEARARDERARKFGVVADDQVDWPGFFPTSAGAGRPLVVGPVCPGSFASRHGVRPTDRLTEVNCRAVTSMRRPSLERAWRRRPLRLTFQRQRQDERPLEAPRGRSEAFLVRTKEQQVFDAELLDVRRRREELASHKDGMAALGLGFVPSLRTAGEAAAEAAPVEQDAGAALPIYEESQESEPFDFEIGELQRTLGWRPLPALRRGEIHISNVEGWVLELGLQEGDRLVAVDSEPVESMSVATLVERMRCRPLKLTFRRPLFKQVESEDLARRAAMQRSGAFAPLRDAAEPGVGHLDAEAERKLWRGLLEGGCGYEPPPNAEDRLGGRFRPLSRRSVELEERLQAAEAREERQKDDSPQTLSLWFGHLAVGKVDREKFRAELLELFKTELSVDAAVVASLRVRFQAVSSVAEVKGRGSAIRELRRLLSEVTVVVADCEGGLLVDVDVPEYIDKLGFVPTVEPSGELLLASVGGWAQEQGLHTGWELVSIGGCAVKELSEDECKRQLRTRPTSLIFLARGRRVQLKKGWGFGNMASDMKKQLSKKIVGETTLEVDEDGISETAEVPVVEEVPTMEEIPVVEEEEREEEHEGEEEEHIEEEEEQEEEHVEEEIDDPPEAAEAAIQTDIMVEPAEEHGTQTEPALEPESPKEPAEEQGTQTEPAHEEPAEEQATQTDPVEEIPVEAEEEWVEEEGEEWEEEWAEEEAEEEVQPVEMQDQVVQTDEVEHTPEEPEQPLDEEEHAAALVSKIIEKGRWSRLESRLVDKSVRASKREALAPQRSKVEEMPPPEEIEEGESEQDEEEVEEEAQESIAEEDSDDEEQRQWEARLINKRTIVAGVKVETLGLLPSSPPGPLVVKSVDAGSWSDRKGVKEGDEIHAINGESTKNMSKSDLKKAVKLRPLELTFIRQEPQPDTERREWTIIALETDLVLGFKPSKPPAPLVLLAVDPGSWSEIRGLQVNDELVALNGESVADMTKEDLRMHITERPLELTFAREVEKGKAQADVDGGYVVHAGEEVKQLGFLPSGMPPERVFVVDVTPNTWSEDADVRVGDELVAANGHLLTELTSSQLKKIMVQRPLELTFIPVEENGAIVPGVPFMLTAEEDVEELGWVPEAVTDMGAIVVKTVHPKTWAAELGLKAEDELLSINGYKVEELSRQEVKQFMRNRPLELQFLRSNGETEEEQEDVRGAKKGGQKSKSKEKDKDKSKGKDADKDRTKEKDKGKSKDKSDSKSKDKDTDKSKDKEKSKDKDKDRDKSKSRDKSADAGKGKDAGPSKEKDKSKDKEKDKDKDKAREKDGSKNKEQDKKDKDKDKKEKDKDKKGKENNQGKENSKKEKKQK